MNNTSLSPVRTFNDLMEDLFNNHQPRLFRNDFFNDNWLKEHRRTPVNISETEDSYHLEVVAPGIKKEDLKVNVHDNTLDISFENNREKETTTNEDGRSVLRQEFQMQSFKRSFTLSDKVDADKIAARYENGILHLDIPKKEEAKATNKVIEVA